MASFPTDRQKLVVAVRESERRTRRLFRRGAHGCDNLGTLAAVHVSLANCDTAVELLSSVMRLGAYFGPDYLRIDPIWEPLQGHPGFEQLLKGVD